jgi:hypothetical protein
MANAVKDLPVYQSHKKVRALEIVKIFTSENGAVTLSFPDDYPDRDVNRPQPGDFYIRYADGYESISPRQAFPDGYKREADVKHAGLSVAGYRPQTSEAVGLVNANKVGEEHLLRQLDVLKTKDVDQRWLSIARTHIEEGFMALNRAIFKPERVKLPEDQG